MTDITGDRLLRNILLDAVEKEYAEELASAEKPATSLRFQRQMKKMLQDPNKWAKQRKRPLWRTYIQKAAVLLLICSVVLGGIMVASPTVRANVVEWAVEWYETQIVYRFFGTPDLAEMPEYEITALPSGYKVFGEIVKMIDNVGGTYKDAEGHILYFQYMRMTEGSAFAVGKENMEVYEIEVQSCLGHLYLSTDPKESNAVVWQDDQANMQFWVDGFFDKEELIRIANSVYLCNTTK